MFKFSNVLPFPDEILDALKSGTLSRKQAENGPGSPTSNGNGASAPGSPVKDAEDGAGGVPSSSPGSPQQTILQVEHGVILNAKTDQVEHVIVEKEKRGKGCCAIS